MVDMAYQWPESIDEILDGDHAVMLAYATPARGVVLAPVSNFGLHDRGAGVVTFNSSVGAWKKLDRIRRNPHVALAFHTRAHATHDRPEYVLVQGRASLSPPVPDYPSTVVDNWERFEPWRGLGPVWKRWLRVYALRVEVRVAVERVVVWPDLACRGSASVHGPALPDEPPAPQAPPAKGVAPRINHKRAARRARRLPDVLFGWLGADGFPVIIPVGVGGVSEAGLLLDAPGGLVPHGGRRAGLTAHWFSRGVVGQRQMIHTGWMTVPSDGGPVTYAPQTTAAYRMPPSRFVYRTAVGLVTRRRNRQAVRAGVDLG
jgi:Pyridoxamine 5'-phosphate oxidase